MRKILFLVLSVVLAGCSVSDGDKARRLIEQYLETNAHDPSSVEIINIAELNADSASVFEGTALYAFLRDEIENAKKSIQEDNDMREFYEEEIKENEAEIEEHRKTFEPFFRWSTEVAYRAKNAFGALVRTTATVKFNKEMTEIVDFQTSEE